MLDTTVKDVYNRLWAIFIHVFEDINDFQKKTTDELSFKAIYSCLEHMRIYQEKEIWTKK